MSTEAAPSPAEAVAPGAEAPSMTLRAFRAVAIAEGVSFLLLLGVAMPLKYLLGLPQAVQVLGLLHGMLFIAYLGFGPSVFIEARWPLARVPGFLLAAVLPFGTFAMERRWLRA